MTKPKSNFEQLRDSNIEFFGEKSPWNRLIRSLQNARTEAQHLYERFGFHEYATLVMTLDDQIKVVRKMM